MPRLGGKVSGSMRWAMVNNMIHTHPIRSVYIAQNTQPLCTSYRDPTSKQPSSNHNLAMTVGDRLENKQFPNVIMNKLINFRRSEHPYRLPNCIFCDPSLPATNLYS